MWSQLVLWRVALLTWGKKLISTTCNWDLILQSQLLTIGEVSVAFRPSSLFPTRVLSPVHVLYYGLQIVSLLYADDVLLLLLSDHDCH